MQYTWFDKHRHKKSLFPELFFFISLKSTFQVTWGKLWYLIKVSRISSKLICIKVKSSQEVTLTCSLAALIPHLSAYFSASILYRPRLIWPRAEGSPCVLSQSAPITVLQKDTSALSGRLSEWKCHLKSSTPIEWFPVTEQGHTVLQTYNKQMSCAEESERSHTAAFTLFTREGIFLTVCLYQNFIPWSWTWMFSGILCVKYISSFHQYPVNIFHLCTVTVTMLIIQNISLFTKRLRSHPLVTLLGFPLTGITYLWNISPLATFHVFYLF